jgi:pilus assembly protein CpaE
LLLEAIRAGVRECLFFPFEQAALRQSVARLREVANEEPQAPASVGRLYAFVPAKPGCGASTVAVNTALSLTRKKEAKVLLADLDLDHGTCQFLLKQRSSHCVFDALDRIAELDTVWSSITTPSGGLDVLGSTLAQERPPAEPARVRALIEFVRKLYGIVLVDTAGAIDAVTLEILKQAERIVLVCQSDLTSAFLAKEKLRLLRSFELEERVTVVLNRWRKGASLRISDFEAMLGLPVELTLADAPEEMHQAVLSGAGISPYTSLGRELSQFAQLFSKTTSGPAEKRIRKIDYFALVPARFSLTAAGK